MTTTQQPRLATSHDVDAIIMLINQAYAPYVKRIGRKPLPMLVDYGAAVSEHQVWVLDLHKDLTSVLELIPKDTYLLIENIAVLPHYQKQGLGYLLMAFAEEKAQEQGFRELRLYTNEHFVENLKFYAKLGYEETHRKAFKGADVVYLRKMLAGI